MTTNRLLTVLVVLTVVMQGVILYRQHQQPQRPSPPSPTADAPEGVYFDLADFPSKGSAEAKTVIVEFSDYQCPFCARHATTVLPILMEKFVDSGQARYLFANNPLPIHSNAKWLARLAICAGEQGRYWEMHDRLFKFKPDSHGAAVALADDIPLNGSVLESCANEDNLAQDGIIKRDQELAQRLRLVGTPAFAVGRVDNDGRVHVRKLISGAMPVGVFDEVLAEFVKEPKGQARLVGRLNGVM